MISETVTPGAQVFTDEWRSYRPLASLGYCHKRVEHGAREYVRGDAHTNGIESLWSMFKRGYMGTYHKMSKAHLPHRRGARLGPAVQAGGRMSAPRRMP